MRVADNPCTVGNVKVEPVAPTGSVVEAIVGPGVGLIVGDAVGVALGAGGGDEPPELQPAATNSESPIKKAALRRAGMSAVS